MKRSSFEAGLDSYEDTQELFEDDEFYRFEIEEAEMMDENSSQARDPDFVVEEEILRGVENDSGNDEFDCFGVKEAQLMEDLRVRHQIRRDHEDARDIIHRYNDPNFDKFEHFMFEEIEEIRTEGTLRERTQTTQSLDAVEEEEIFQSEPEQKIEEFDHLDLEELYNIPEELPEENDYPKDEFELIEEEIMKKYLEPSSQEVVKEHYIKHVRQLKKPLRRKVKIEETEAKWKEIQDLRVTAKKEQSVVIPPSTILSPETSDENIFFAFLDIDFWVWLAEETNAYYRNERDAVKTKKNLEEHPAARIKTFKETTFDEIRAFIGLYFFMGISKKTETQDYFTSEALTLSLYSKIMSYRRFEDLNHFLQINAKKEGINPSVEKLKHLLKFADKFRTVYTPSSAISIDESMCPFRGRFQHIVYEPRKPHKWGIKLINECDALTGFCIAINPCLGKETYHQDSEIQNLDQLLLKKLTLYNDKSYHFYCDNYYCHPDLASKFKRLGHDMTGTIRLERKDVPCCFAQKKVKQGEAKAFVSEDGVYLLKFRDKRDVHVLTTHDSLCMKDYTSKRGKSFKKPCVLINYSNRMKGVDILNQLTFYNCPLQKTVKWWKKVFFIFLEICMVNAYVISTKVFHRHQGIKEYQRKVARALLGNRLERINYITKPITEGHYPAHITTRWPAPCKACPKKSSLRCEKCSADFGKQVVLCAFPCFKNFHQDPYQYFEQERKRER